MIFTKKWLKAAAVRAVKTFAQTAASLMTVDLCTVKEMPWGFIFSAATVAAIYSVLTSVAGIPEVEEKKNDKQ